jgi:adenylate cyclase
VSQTRRLAAILAADVAGYSRLMGADEEGTLERLKALRRELLDPKIAEHHGRIPGLDPGTKTAGDGLLVEFPSVVAARRSAVTILLRPAAAAYSYNKVIRGRLRCGRQCANWAIRRVSSSQNRC